MALVKDQRILTPVKSPARFSANPVTDLVSNDRTKGNQEEQMRQLEVSSSGKDSGCDQQRIAGKKESNEEARFDEDNCTNQCRAAPLDQALDIEQEMKKAS